MSVLLSSLSAYLITGIKKFVLYKAD